MKKRAFATLCLLLTLILVLFLNISAQDVLVQQNAGAQKAKGIDSLESSLVQLELRLKESVAVDFQQSSARRTYVRLKRRSGCNISLHVSHVPGSPYVHEPGKPGPDLSSAEWRMNLADLDSGEIKIERPAKGDYSVIRFATLGGKASIKWKGFGVHDAAWKSHGQIHVGEKDAPLVAAALEQAILACRE